MWRFARPEFLLAGRNENGGRTCSVETRDKGPRWTGSSESLQIRFFHQSHNTVHVGGLFTLKQWIASSLKQNFSSKSKLILFLCKDLPPSPPPPKKKDVLYYGLVKIVNGIGIFRAFRLERKNRNTSEDFYLFWKLSGGMNCTIGIPTGFFGFCRQMVNVPGSRYFREAFPCISHLIYTIKL